MAAWRDSTSWRKDDSRLHVDAFPSRPNYGERIIRIFTNINPHGEARSWRVGEDFTQLASRYLPHWIAIHRSAVGCNIKSVSPSAPVAITTI